MSDFGTQLRAKQKLKGYYANITEKQFRRYYAEAIRMKGDSGENLIGLLERRLDAVVYRSKFVATPFAARQFVNHGHVKVNGRRVNIPSYLVKPGDVIEVKDASKQLEIVVVAKPARRARRAGLHRGRSHEDDGEDDPRARPRRGALSGSDGAEPRHRVLFALSDRRVKQKGPPCGQPLAYGVDDQPRP